MNVSFPNLGLTFDIQNYFSVFGFKVYWYGVIIAVAFAVSVILASNASKKFGLDSEIIIDLALFAVPISVITARLYYVIFNMSEFKSIVDIINIRRGGLAIYGGIIGAIITTYVFARVKKINILNLMDFGVPYLVLGQAIGRWGNFVNQEAYGTKTNLPWAMSGSNIANGPVHPTFLYESLWNIALFIFLIWFRKRKKLNGEVFFLYMAIYGIGRVWIEGLRTDSLMLGGLRVSQVLALIFAAGFIIAFLVMRMKASENGFPVLETDAQESEKVESKYGALLKTLKQEEIEAKSEKDDETSIDSSKIDLIDNDKKETKESSGNIDGK